MISVPSRRQLSNGSKFLIGLVLVLFISSCSTRKLTKTTEVVPIQPKKINTSRSQEDSVSKKPQVFDIDEKGTPVKTPKVEKKDVNSIYNIAVILPLFLDQIPLGMYADDTTKQLTGDSKNALAFYTGCQMAREKFVSDNLKANVYFIDDENDSATLTSIFRQKPFPNVDYIIGPFTFKNLKTAADIAKKNQTPIISPVANSMYIKDNPFYYNAYPSLKTQYGFILEKAKAKFAGKTLEVIYDGDDELSENISVLKDIADKYYGSNIRYTSLQTTDDAVKMMTLPDTTSERVLLIYSSKDIYVKTILAKLKPIKNHLDIFTSAAVKNTKSLADSKYPHTIYSVSPYNTEGPGYSLFAEKFEEKTKRKPEDLLTEGFDLMMHVLRMLDKKQNLSDNNYNYTTDFDNLQTKFSFKPMLNKYGNTDYYDNTILYLYKYVNGAFVISTP